MEENIQFRHIFPVQIRFSDVDQFGHVNNSVYFSLYDLAKTTYFNDVLGNLIDWNNMAVVVANIKADFIAPIFFSDKIVIETSTIHLGNKSFTLLQRAVNAETQEVKCTCQTICVGFDVKAQIAIEIEERFKEAIRFYEANKELLA